MRVTTQILVPVFASGTIVLLDGGTGIFINIVTALLTALWIALATEVSTLVFDPRIVPIGRSFIPLPRRLHMRMLAEQIVLEVAFKTGHLENAFNYQFGNRIVAIARRMDFSADKRRMFVIFVAEEIAHAEAELCSQAVDNLDEFTVTLTADLVFHTDYALNFPDRKSIPVS